MKLLFLRTERRQLLRDVNISFNLLSHLVEAIQYLYNSPRSQQLTKCKSMYKYPPKTVTQSEP